jgi:DNA-binding protein HU-beta
MAAAKKSTAKKAAKKTTAKKAPAKKATAKKTTRKTTAKKSTAKKATAAAPALEVPTSRIKAAGKDLEVRVSSEFIPAFNEKVAELMKQAAARAKGNGRATVRPTDL